MQVSCRQNSNQGVCKESLLQLNREILLLTEAYRIHDVFSIAQFVVFVAIAKIYYDLRSKDLVNIIFVTTDPGKQSCASHATCVKDRMLIFAPLPNF